MNKNLQKLQEHILASLIKVLADKKIKNIINKIEQDPEAQKAVDNLKTQVDEITPKVKDFIKKYPNSRLAIMLKERGYSDG